MIRNLKTLGLALVAVLAMSAVVASAASALQFTASKYPTTVTATTALGNDVFTTEGGAVECEGHFEGESKEASETMTIKATYTKCKAFGFAEASVNMNGCDYVFHSNGVVDLECHKFNSKGETEKTGPVIITAGACEVQITTQTGLESVALSNNGLHIDAKADVTVTKNSPGIVYTVTKDGFLCPFGGTGSKTGGTYVQKSAATVKPVSGGTSVSID